MTEKDTRRLYEPPRARDLSALAVSGQEPLGQCFPGGSLTFEVCEDGGTPLGGACSPTGIVPEQGYCQVGGRAVEGCISGGIHQ